MTSGEQPVELIFIDGACEPAQKQMRTAREGDLRERDAEGELEEGMVGGCASEILEGALDFATAFCQVLGDNEEICAWIGS